MNWVQNLMTLATVSVSVQCVRLHTILYNPFFLGLVSVSTTVSVIAPLQAARLLRAPKLVVSVTSRVSRTYVWDFNFQQVSKIFWTKIMFVTRHRINSKQPSVNTSLPWVIPHLICPWFWSEEMSFLRRDSSLHDHTYSRLSGNVWKLPREQ